MNEWTAILTSSDTTRVAKTEAADAKARSLRYLSRYKCACRFEEAEAVLDGLQAHAVFVALVSAMRQKDRSARAEDLRFVLFGRPHDHE
jgi:hypothetical protein